MPNADPGPRQSLWGDLLLLLGAVLAALFIRTYVVEPKIVDGQSMEPALHTDERLEINKLVYHFRLPRTGELVVFRFPANPRRDFIKRVIAHEGQTVEIRQGQVYVDGAPLAESYIAYWSNSNYPRTLIKPGHIFVLGDNRVNSEDSRYPEVGQVPLANVKGMVFLRYWPPDRFRWFGGGRQGALVRWSG